MKESRHLRSRGFSPRRSVSGSGRVEMYFPEVDVDVRQRPGAREPSSPFSHIRSTEDISSGYCSAEPLCPAQSGALSASREPLVRTASVGGSTRSLRSKGSRGGSVAKRGGIAEGSDWRISDDNSDEDECFYDIPSLSPPSAVSIPTSVPSSTCLHTSLTADIISLNSLECAISSSLENLANTSPVMQNDETGRVLSLSDEHEISNSTVLGVECENNVAKTSSLMRETDSVSRNDELQSVISKLSSSDSESPAVAEFYMSNDDTCGSEILELPTDLMPELPGLKNSEPTSLQNGSNADEINKGNSEPITILKCDSNKVVNVDDTLLNEKTKKEIVSTIADSYENESLVDNSKEDEQNTGESISQQNEISVRSVKNTEIEEFVCIDSKNTDKLVAVGQVSADLEIKNLILSTKLPEAKTIAQPEAKTLAQPEPETLAQPVAKTLTQLEAKTLSQPEPETLAQPEAKTLTQPEAKTLTQPEAKTLAQPEAETLAQREAETLAQPEAKTLTQPETKTLTQPEAKTLAQPEAETLAQREAETLAQPEAKTLTQPEAKTFTQPEAKTLAQPEAETLAQREAETLAQPEAETLAQREAETLAQPEAETVAQPADEHKTDVACGKTVDVVFVGSKKGKADAASCSGTSGQDRGDCTETEQTAEPALGIRQAGPAEPCPPAELRDEPCERSASQASLRKDGRAGRYYKRPAPVPPCEGGTCDVAHVQLDPLSTSSTGDAKREPSEQADVIGDPPSELNIISPQIRARLVLEPGVVRNVGPVPDGETSRPEVLVSKPKPKRKSSKRKYVESTVSRIFAMPNLTSLLPFWRDAPSSRKPGGSAESSRRNSSVSSASQGDESHGWIAETRKSPSPSLLGPGSSKSSMIFAAGEGDLGETPSAQEVKGILKKTSISGSVRVRELSHSPARSRQPAPLADWED
ncbi:retinitis pigmentosa 1-like 1 protein isoform X3 [Bacillus rossius redtenbacheri]|uniref:retinitis pigmentosa 1-like 1 protein isoform X3 n=1 Tax=Bacillus rossius redtenbacheri TaxID=93214 RepID=UPI002FDD6886